MYLWLGVSSSLECVGERRKSTRSSLALIPLMILISKFSTEAEEKLKKVEEILPSLSRRFRMCDPPSHVEGQTFLQVKGFLQVTKCSDKMRLSAVYFIICFLLE